MFSKVLIGMFAVIVMSVGGFAYYNHSTGCCPLGLVDSPGTSCSPVEQSAEVPSCCQQPSRLSLSIESPCCGFSEASAAGTVEVLAIAPREVK